MDFCIVDKAWPKFTIFFCKEVVTWRDNENINNNIKSRQKRLQEVWELSISNFIVLFKWQVIKYRQNYRKFRLGNIQYKAVSIV